MGYFRNILKGIKTTWQGLRLTSKHLRQARVDRGHINLSQTDFFNHKIGRVTLTYPHQNQEIPPLGRYQLHNEIDDCINCDKCVKICPSNCIDIVAIKAPEVIKYASDGSPMRFYFEKFDIDLAKCCFCGLCTVVCPTDCLTMNNKFDYSVDEVSLLKYAFGNLTESEAQQKREMFEQFKIEKTEHKIAGTTPQEAQKSTTPKFQPKFKPKGHSNEIKEQEENKAPEAPSRITSDKQETEKETTPKFQPKFKPKGHSNSNEIKEQEENKAPEAPSRITSDKQETEKETTPKFQPKFKPKGHSNSNEIKEQEENKAPEAPSRITSDKQETEKETTPKFQPKFKPKGHSNETQTQKNKPDAPTTQNKQPKHTPNKHNKKK